MSETTVTPELLRRFSPLDGLKRENVAALAKKMEIRALDGSRPLLTEGDTDKRTYYLVSGTLELTDRNGTVRLLRANTEEARGPVTPMLPRRYTVRAVDRAEYVSVDTELLDVMLTWDQTGSYEVNELRSDDHGNSDDWMTTLLQTKAFHRIPPGNIQAIFMRMQKVQFSAGDVIIKQGDEGDYFYVITRGKCIVTRETPLNKEGIKLAELNAGDTFGEEALIAEAKRNATVTMLTDGVLMRLNKQDFRELMNEPLLQWVTDEQAREIVAKGGKWLDVRLPSEYQNLRIEDSINIPLYFIRMKLGTLDRGTPYVVCCDTGRRSSAAAFILVERGFDAYVLKGGLTNTDLGLQPSG